MQALMLFLVVLAGVVYFLGLGWWLLAERGIGRWNRSCDEAALKEYRRLRERSGDNWNVGLDPLKRQAIEDVLKRIQPPKKS